MATCNHENCEIEFGVLNHKYACSGCARIFCDKHVCSYSYLINFGGMHLPLVEKAITDKGYLCEKCVEKSGINLSEWRKSLFEKKCAHVTCDATFGTFTPKTSCVSCGKWYCSTHCKITRADVGDKWLKVNMHFPMAEKVCISCFGGTGEKIEKRSFPSHPQTSLLRHMAGKMDGERQAIVIHGILSNFEQMVDLSDSLVKKNVFDTIWCFDDIAYRGRVNEGKGVSFADIPLGIDFKTIGKAVLKKAFDVTDLPAYIIEGAAQTLALVIKTLNKKNITIIGHSMGGIVARCTVESYELQEFVDHVVTLASPHRMWMKIFGGKLELWNGIPNENINYLAILGKGDFVAATQSISDFTDNDSKYNFVTKVLIKGDHTSIHARPYGTYVPELIHGLLQLTDDFYIEVRGGIPYLKYSLLHGRAKEEPLDKPHGVWLEFNPGLG